MEKSTPLWCQDCRFVSFETGLGKPMLTLNDPNGLKNSTNVYSIHLELRMALPCQISTGKWKYVNPCLDFLGIPDQRTAYVKRQARPRWTYVRRSSVTLDLVNQSVKQRGGLFEITRPMTYECIRKLGTYLHPRNDHPIKKQKIFHKIQWRTCPEGPQIQAWYFRQACIRSIWASGMELFAKGN